MAEYEKKLRHALSQHGFTLLRRGKGSHDIWYQPDSHIKVTVPNKIKSRHMANVILKDAKINVKF